MKTILVPTDFSDQAGYALDLAKQLATNQDALIHLIHIVEHPGSHYLTAVSGDINQSMDNVYVLQLIERVKTQLQKIVNDLANEGIAATYKIKIGNPFKHISSQIKDESYDLIVMGTLGTSGISEVLVGSNTEKVIRYANCPVITLKNPVNLNHVKDVVFAVNHFNARDNLANQLRILQDLFTAKLHLVTINTPGNFLIQREVTNSLKSFVEEYQIPHYSINIYSDITEEEGIVHFAEDINADVITMATHGRTGISHLLAGSLTEDIVNHSTLPVVTFPIAAKGRKSARTKVVSEG